MLRKGKQLERQQRSSIAAKAKSLCRRPNLAMAKDQKSHPRCKVDAQNMMCQGASRWECRLLLLQMSHLLVQPLQSEISS